MKPQSSWLQAICRPVLDFVFPRVCLSCNAWLDPREPGLLNFDDPSPAPQPENLHPIDLFWCQNCLNKIVSNPNTSCPYCHAQFPQERFRKGRCRLCRGKKLRWDAALAVGNYQGILQQQVLQMKGLRDEPLAWQMGRLLAAKHRLLANSLATWGEIDLVVPIPIHWWKRIQRGFHASQLIAEGFCSVRRYPLAQNVLRYKRLTAKQGLLNTTARFRNVADAFAVKRRVAISGSRILLVDDVMTSGATLAVAAQVLKQHGARCVLAGVIARGTRHH